MLQKILLHVKQCPILETMPVMAEFLGEEEGNIGIFAVGCEPVIEQYADGGTLKQFIFKILARDSSHSLFRVDSQSILETVGQYLEKGHTMPDLKSGQTAQKFKVIKVTGRQPTGFCRELVCQLVYYEERGVTDEQNSETK